MSLGEICDRYSIVLLKSQRTTIDCSDELNQLKTEINKLNNLSSYIEQLVDVNGQIWDLESDIRKGKEGCLA